MFSPALNIAAPADWPMPSFGAWPLAANEHHVIVIGAGIGGLTAAALLAKRGLKVLVLEAHDRPGGSCTSWTRKIRCRDGTVAPFTFDAGVQDFSGLGPQGPLRHVLAELAVASRIKWHPVRHRYVHNGMQIDMPEHAIDHGAKDLGRVLAQAFPREAEFIPGFITTITDLYSELYAGAAGNDGIPLPPSSLDDLVAWGKQHPLIDRWMTCSWHEFLDTFFQDPQLKDLLTVISEYVTDQPALLTVGDMVPLLGYYLVGGAYPAGGSQTLANTLSSVIEENGGRVTLDTEVVRVLIESDRVAGIATRGEMHRAPLIINNSDFATVFSEMIDPGSVPARFHQRIQKRRRGPSAVLVSLALDQQPDIPARLFLSKAALRFGIGNPCAVDHTLAPPGHAVLTLMLLVPEDECVGWLTMDRRDYRQRKRLLTSQLIAAASEVIPGLAQSILYQQTGTPRTAKRYLRTANGSIYGAARRQWAPGVRSPVPGLLLTGGGCRLGAGIEPAVISGMAAAQLARRLS